MEVRAGDYDALTDAALVIITAGVNEQAGGATDRSDPQGRLRLLDTMPERCRSRRSWQAGPWPSNPTSSRA